MKTNKEKRIQENRNSPNVILLNDDELYTLKETLLEIYMDVKKVCEKNNITCLLLGGSALGSVRHKGFIPWDDDFDIGMSRDDYEVFKKVFKQEMAGKYTLNAPNYEGKATNRFPKVLKNGTRFVEIGMEDDERACIKIDIFIIENVPDRQYVKLLKGLYCTVLMTIGGNVLYYETIRQNTNDLRKRMGRYIAGAMFSFLPSNRWFDIIDRACQHSNSDSKKVNIPTGRKHYFGEILDRETFFPVGNGLFEGLDVNLPGDSEKYLTNLYGNYMEIPPEDKREKHYIKRIAF